MHLHSCSSVLKYTEHELRTFFWYLWWEFPSLSQKKKKVLLLILIEILGKWDFGERGHLKNISKGPMILERINQWISLPSSLWTFIYDWVKNHWDILVQKQKIMWSRWLKPKTPDSQSHMLHCKFLFFILWLFSSYSAGLRI